MQLIERLLSDASAYFAVYLLLFAFMTIECAFPLKASLRLNFARLSFVGLTLILALRWETGTDWDSYIELFRTLQLDTSSLVAVYSFDIGYVFENAFVRLFTSNYTVFLLINSTIAMLLAYQFIRRLSPFPNTSVFIFYNSYFVAHYMGSNRRIIAIGLLLLLFAQPQRVRLPRFALLQGLAIAFHRSSFIGVLSRLVPDKPFSRSTILVMFLVCGTFGALQLPVGLVESLGHLLARFSNLEIIDKMIFYGENSAEHVSENVNVFAQTMLAVAKRALFLGLYFYVFRQLKDNATYTRLLNIYIVGIAIYVLFIGSPIFQVLSTYFCAVEIALTAMAAARLPRIHRINLCCLLLPYGILQLSSAINPYPDLYLPYMSVFSEAPRWIAR
jgi:hypothetical protein